MESFTPVSSEPLFRVVPRAVLSLSAVTFEPGAKSWSAFANEGSRFHLALRLVSVHWADAKGWVGLTTSQPELVVVYEKWRQGAKFHYDGTESRI